MKAIIYKRRGRIYECTDIKDSPESTCKVIFEEPIDAKIKLGERIISVARGVGEFDAAAFEHGEYSPLLISCGAVTKMESLIFKDGGVSRPVLREDYIRALSARIEENAELVLSLEERINELERKMENTINF